MTKKTVKKATTKQAVKKWYQSKTIIIGLATAISGIIALFQTEYPEISILVTLKGVSEIVIRFLTSTSVE